MSESKHTPGPWEAIDSPGAGWNVHAAQERPGYTGKAPICSMAWFQFDIPDVINDQISEANARLIAAAPELLEACKEVLKVGFFGHFSDSEEYIQKHIEPVVKMLHSAIARATGE